MTDPTITNAAPRKELVVRLPLALYEELKDRAGWEERSIAATIRLALRQYLSTPMAETALRHEPEETADRALAVPVVEETSGRVLWEDETHAIRIGGVSMADNWSAIPFPPGSRVRVVLAADQPNEDQTVHDEKTGMTVPVAAPLPEDKLVDLMGELERSITDARKSRKRRAADQPAEVADP